MEESSKKLNVLDNGKQQQNELLKELTEVEKQELLLRIARHLILHSSFCPYSGLLKGKMGVAIFFYELFNATNQKVYDDYAGDLIDEIYEKIKYNSSPYFNDGLAGIGWGFEYIIRKKYVGADADDILDSLDKQIMERDVRKITNIDLDRGLKGIAHYIIARCANRDKYMIETQYIKDLINAFKLQATQSQEVLILTSFLIAIIQHQTIQESEIFALEKYIKTVQYESENIFNEKRTLGILDNGYASIGLKLLKS